MKHIYLFSILLLFTACAVVVHPKGGETDSEPPVMIHSDPDSLELNVNRTTFQLQFDEYFEIKDPNNLLLSPPLPEKPKLTIKGKTLEIKIKSGLKPNTTYEILYNNLVQDITEKNVQTGGSIIFSTGNQLDTSKLKGKIINNLTSTPQSGFKVALIQSPYSLPDSMIFPQFVTFSDNQGEFEFSSLPANQTYYIYAFKDLNFNNRIEDGEEAGFLKDSITVNDSTAYLIKTGIQKTFPPFRLKETKSISSQSFSISFENNTEKTIHISRKINSNEKGTELLFYHWTKDSLLVFDPVIPNKRSYYIYLDDQLTDSFTLDNDSTEIHFIPLNYKEQKEPYDSLFILYPFALQSIRQSRIHLVQDSLILPIKITGHPFGFTIHFTPVSKGKYQLILEDSSLAMNSSYWNKTDTLTFHYTDFNQYGDMHISWFRGKAKNYEIQLLKSTEGPVLYRQITNDTSALFTQIPAGEYTIRLIENQHKSPHFVRVFREELSPAYMLPNSIRLRGTWSINDIIIHNKP